MKRSLSVVLFLVLPMSAQAPRQTAAQAPRQTPVEDDLSSRITLDVTRVNMLFTVSDKKGRFVTNLDRGDFEVSEAKKNQNILEFTAETNLPLRIGILIDTSN